MDIGKYAIVLAVFFAAVLTVQPVLSATTMTSNNLEKDIATSYFNQAQRLIASCIPGGSCDYQMAISLYDKALASNTTMLRKTDGILYLYQGRAYAQIELANYSDAIATADAGLALYPKDAILWNNRGYALQRLGKMQDALASYDKSVSYDRNYTIAFINRGDVLSRMGRYTEAVAAYTRANETDPFNIAAYEGLKAARTGEAESTRTMTILSVIILIAITGIVVWYVKFRKPAEPAPKEKKAKSKKK